MFLFLIKNLVILLVAMQAAKFIEYDSSFGEEEKKQAKALKVTCNLNNAACKLKLKDYKEAQKLCTKVVPASQDLGGICFFYLMLNRTFFSVLC